MDDSLSQSFTNTDIKVMKERFRGYLPVIIDVETGGFNASTDAILEIGATTLEMDGSGFLEIKETLFYAVNPFEGANLEKEALEFTGIDPNDDERGAIDECDALTELFKHIKQEMKINGCKRAILVGHNAAFDLGFMKAASQRHGLHNKDPFHPFSTLDTVSYAAIAYGQTVLAKSCLMAGIDFDHQSAHNAAYDAEKTAELFCSIFNQWLNLNI